MTPSAACAASRTSEVPLPRRVSARSPASFHRLRGGLLLLCSPTAADRVATVTKANAPIRAGWRVADTAFPRAGSACNRAAALVLDATMADLELA